MSKNLIFLSHTHSESEIAVALKNALVSEFSGFVSVFVSSDGTSIPAGSNFLTNIEKALTKCVAAIFLISPTSVKKNWINFELGAVWLRNLNNQADSSQYVPAIPICHSGMKPDDLPIPLSLLNGIEGADPDKLAFVFKSIQKALGVEGQLRTDFDALAESIQQIEYKLTTVDTLKEILVLIGNPQKTLQGLIQYTAKYPLDFVFPVMLGLISNEIISKLEPLCNKLGNKCRLQKTDFATVANESGSVSGADVTLSMSSELIKKSYEFLNGKL
jgi:hypothetical protein